MRFPALAGLFSLSLLVACGGDQPVSNQNANANRPVVVNVKPIQPTVAVDPGFETCNPYFPLVPGSLAVFSVTYSSGLTADARVIVEAVEANGRPELIQTTQIVDSGGGYYKAEETRRTFVCGNGSVQLISEEGSNRVEQYENTYKTQFLSDAVTMVETSSFRPGGKWSYRFKRFLKAPDQDEMSSDTITIFFEIEGEEDVTVPAGKFRAYKVVQSIAGRTVIEHFVPGLGLVSRALDDGSLWVLKEYAGLSPEID